MNGIATVLPALDFIDLNRDEVQVADELAVLGIGSLPMLWNSIEQAAQHGAVRGRRQGQRNQEPEKEPT